MDILENKLLQKGLPPRPVKSYEPFEFMVKCTPQREWIERQGLLLWLAFFFGFGGALYLVAMYFGSLWGLLLGWMIVVAGKGGFHLLYLGKPTRFWRAFRRPKSSWIARGLIFVAAFIVLGAVHMALNKWQPGTGATRLFAVLAGLSALLTATYTGFVMSYVRAIPFWNSPLLPAIIITSAFLGGSGGALALALAAGDTGQAKDAELAVRILVTVLAGMLALHLGSTFYGPKAGREATRLLLRGKPSYSLPFWLGLVGIGIVVPLVLVWYPYAFNTEAGNSWLFVGIVCEIIGGLSLRYSLLRAGTYTPLLPLGTTRA